MSQCPEDPVLFGEKESRKCVVNCPDNFYGDDLSQ